MAKTWLDEQGQLVYGWTNKVDSTNRVNWTETQLKQRRFQIKFIDQLGLRNKEVKSKRVCIGLKKEMDEIFISRPKNGKINHENNGKVDPISSALLSTFHSCSEENLYGSLIPT